MNHHIMKPLTSRPWDVIIDRIITSLGEKRKEVLDTLITKTPQDPMNIGIQIGMLRVMEMLPGLIDQALRDREED